MFVWNSVFPWQQRFDKYVRLPCFFSVSWFHISCFRSSLLFQLTILVLISSQGDFLTSRRYNEIHDDGSNMVEFLVIQCTWSSSFVPSQKTKTTRSKFHTFLVNLNWLFYEYNLPLTNLPFCFVLYHHYIITDRQFLGICIQIVLISLQENIKHGMRKAGNRQTLLRREGQLQDDFRMTFANEVGWFSVQHTKLDKHKILET